MYVMLIITPMMKLGEYIEIPSVHVSGVVQTLFS